MSTRGRKLLLRVGVASGAAVGRFAPNGIASVKLFRRIHLYVPRARSATLQVSSTLGDSHAALGFAERTMPGVLRGVHPFSTSSASTDFAAPSWRRIVKELLEEARVDKAVQTRVQDVLEHPTEALARADKALARADKALARADETIVSKNAELASKNAELASKNAELARADKELEKAEEAFSMQLNAVHADLLMMHAVYMPRALASTLLCALRAPNAESQSIGSKAEIRAFVDAHIYEPGKGLGVPAGKRCFTPVALQALSSWSHSDVLSIHKAIEGLFSEWSMPRHVLVKDAQGPGSVIGARGEPMTSGEFIFFSVGIALLEQRIKPGVPWPAALDGVRIIVGKTPTGKVAFDSRTLGRSTTPAGRAYVHSLCT